MSLDAMSWTWKLRLPPTEKYVLLAISDNANDETFHAWPSLTHLTKKCGLSRSTLVRVIDALVAKELVERTGHTTKNGNTIYQVKIGPSQFLDDTSFMAKLVSRQNRGSATMKLGVVSPENSKPSIEPPRTLKERSGDARHAPLKTFVESEYKRITTEALPTDKSCWSVFGKMLQKYHQPEYTLEYFQESWRRFLTSPDRFVKTAPNPLRYWASRPHAFSPNLRTADAKRSRSEILDAATEKILAGEVHEDLFRDHGPARPGTADREGVGPESDGLPHDAC